MEIVRPHESLDGLVRSELPVMEALRQPLLRFEAEDVGFLPLQVVELVPHPEKIVEYVPDRLDGPGPNHALLPQCRQVVALVLDPRPPDRRLQVAQPPAPLLDVRLQKVDRGSDLGVPRSHLRDLLPDEFVAALVVEEPVQLPP